jgi:hemerythrin
MDAEHKRMFEIVRELYTAMRSGQGGEVAGGVFRRLIDHTSKHFAAEEKLMEDHGYPLLALHRAEHKGLADQILAFKKDFDAGSSAVLPQLLGFMDGWLKNHTQTVDQKYVAFLTSRGVH